MCDVTSVVNLEITGFILEQKQRLQTSFKMGWDLITAKNENRELCVLSGNMHMRMSQKKLRYYRIKKIKFYDDYM